MQFRLTIGAVILAICAGYLAFRIPVSAVASPVVQAQQKPPQPSPSWVVPQLSLPQAQPRVIPAPQSPAPEQPSVVPAPTSPPPQPQPVVVPAPTSPPPQPQPVVIPVPQSPPPQPVPVIIQPIPAPAVSLPFSYSFSVVGSLAETGEMRESSSPYWWVSSGGLMELKDGVGQTIQGALDVGDQVQRDYAKANPVDTDRGVHPQNIFRMVFRSKWQDVSQELYYKIGKINMSTSPNRKASNGIQQMSRYLDQDNLYYTGLRVDGQATIKKKYHGDYYEMAAVPVINGAYDRRNHPDLLPAGTWIGLRTVIKNLDAARVSIQLYTDIGKTGKWTLVASAIDDGVSYGGRSLTAAGYVGARTDFMNVQFDDFSLENVN